ncbi:UNVERIFIED_CONTAM: hypothetical protein K2H54_034717 [Gekko kuhli]
MRLPEDRGFLLRPNKQRRDMRETAREVVLSLWSRSFLGLSAARVVCLTRLCEQTCPPGWFTHACFPIEDHPGVICTSAHHLPGGSGHLSLFPILNREPVWCGGHSSVSYLNVFYVK